MMETTGLHFIKQCWNRAQFLFYTLYKTQKTVNTVNDLTIHFDPLYLPVSLPALFLPIEYLIVY